MFGRAELDGLPETGHRLDGVADDPPVAGGEEAGKPVGDRVVPREGPVGVEGLPHQVPVLPQVEAAGLQHGTLDAGLGEAPVLQGLETLELNLTEINIDVITPSAFHTGMISSTASLPSQNGSR